MNEDAATIKDWADRNGLMLNTAKTKAVLFASFQQRRFFNDADVPPLIIDNTIIPLEDKIMQLGSNDVQESVMGLARSWRVFAGSWSSPSSAIQSRHA
ncbi:hypothetical protein TKK_0009510 [Trichogramma kaykai]